MNIKNKIRFWYKYKSILCLTRFYLNYITNISQRFTNIITIINTNEYNIMSYEKYRMQNSNKTCRALMNQYVKFIEGVEKMGLLYLWPNK